MPTPNVTQLKQALALAEQIAKLEAELAFTLGGSTPVVTARHSAPAPAAKHPKGTLAAAARAKISAAQKARWAKVKGTAVATSKARAAAPTKKGGLTPEGRARIVAALKARWAAKKNK